jgi:hypothetical protein
VSGDLTTPIALARDGEHALTLILPPIAASGSLREELTHLTLTLGLAGEPYLVGRALVVEEVRGGLRWMVAVIEGVLRGRRIHVEREGANHRNAFLDGVRAAQAEPVQTWYE